jgi:hypothetical protein
MIEAQKGQQENLLLHQSPSEVLNWLRSAWSDPRIMPEGFNWLGLAEGAGTKANLNADLQWAEVAIRIYEWLASRANDEDIRHSDLSSAMSLRASMINKKHQTIPDHIVLDSQRIVNWFYSKLNMYDDEVVPMIENWRALPLDQIRTLKRIKNRLSILKALVAQGYIQPDESLQTWLELYSKLP